MSWEPGTNLFDNRTGRTGRLERMTQDGTHALIRTWAGSEERPVEFLSIKRDLQAERFDDMKSTSYWEKTLSGLSPEELAEVAVVAEGYAKWSDIFADLNPSQIQLLANAAKDLSLRG